MSRKSLPRIATEFVLIVAGVTVALAAESAWTWRQERATEHEYLAQLVTDLEENEARLTAAIALETGQQAGARAARAALGRGDRISPDSAQSWLFDQRGLYYSDPRLLTGTFIAVAETSELRLMRDPEIRRAILSYLPQIDADRHEFNRWVGEHAIHLRPFGSLEAASEAVRQAQPDPRARTMLDGVIAANEVRLFYLNSMLDATVATASSLARR